MKAITQPKLPGRRSRQGAAAAGPRSGKPLAQAGFERFAPCVEEGSLLETLPVIASRAFGNAFLISRFGPFREHPQRTAMQRLEISWSAEIEFAPQFSPQKTKGPKVNTTNNQ